MYIKNFMRASNNKMNNAFNPLFRIFFFFDRQLLISVLIVTLKLIFYKARLRPVHRKYHLIFFYIEFFFFFLEICLTIYLYFSSKYMIYERKHLKFISRMSTQFKENSF